jgi:hypothetical protein
MFVATSTFAAAATWIDGKFFQRRLRGARQLSPQHSGLSLDGLRGQPISVRDRPNQGCLGSLGDSSKVIPEVRVGIEILDQSNSSLLVAEIGPST